jgi:hypothetical protein
VLLPRQRYAGQGRPDKEHAMSGTAAQKAIALVGVAISAAERRKVDWFGQQRLSTVLQSLPLRLRVT